MGEASRGKRRRYQESGDDAKMSHTMRVTTAIHVLLRDGERGLGELREKEAKREDKKNQYQ